MLYYVQCIYGGFDLSSKKFDRQKCCLVIVHYILYNKTPFAQVSTAILSTTAKKAAKSKTAAATPMEVDPPAAAAAEKKG